MSGNQFFKLAIVSVVYLSLGTALAYAVAKIQQDSEELALIVAVIFTPLLVAFFWIMFIKIKEE